MKHNINNLIDIAYWGLILFITVMILIYCIDNNMLIIEFQNMHSYTVFTYITLIPVIVFSLIYYLGISVLLCLPVSIIYFINKYKFYKKSNN